MCRRRVCSQNLGRSHLERAAPETYHALSIARRLLALAERLSSDEDYPERGDDRLRVRAAEDALDSPSERTIGVMHSIVETIELLAANIDDEAAAALQVQVQEQGERGSRSETPASFGTSRDLAAATIHHLVRVLGARRAPDLTSVRMALLAARRRGGAPRRGDIAPPKWEAMETLLKACGLTTAGARTIEQEIRRERLRRMGGTTE
jgi:hypothetical protein